jgi:hypothetical protein
LMQYRCSSRSVIFAENNNATRAAYTLSLTRWLHATDAVCWRKKIHVWAWRSPPSPYHSTPLVLHYFPRKKKSRQVLFEQTTYVYLFIVLLVIKESIFCSYLLLMLICGYAIITIKRGKQKLIHIYTKFPHLRYKVMSLYRAMHILVNFKEFNTDNNINHFHVYIRWGEDGWEDETEAEYLLNIMHTYMLPSNRIAHTMFFSAELLKRNLRINTIYFMFS